MTETRTIYIGHDRRESLAYRAAVNSIVSNAGDKPPFIGPISSRTLGALYGRPTLTTPDGNLWDVISDAPMATEFSLARFFVPVLHRGGWALFCDCDFMFRADVNDLFALADDRFAVMCVQHDHKPAETVKMDGQVQVSYRRKNWSSLFLVNCDAPEIRNFTVEDANTLTGKHLHAFEWLDDSRIGALPVEWNWLAGVSEPVTYPKAVHFTLGTPDMPGYSDAPFADEWWNYARR